MLRRSDADNRFLNKPGVSEWNFESETVKACQLKPTEER